MENYKITDNFTFYELTNTSYKSLLEKNRVYGEKIKTNVKILAELLQSIRDLFGKPVYINSGVRCPELNKKVGGTANSRHMSGLAADIRVKDMTDKEVFERIKAANLPLLQKAIHEKVNGREWVHVQARTAADKALAQYLATNDGKKYTIVV